MLEQARKRQEAYLDSENDVTNRVEDEFLPKQARDKGAVDLVGKVRKLRKQLDDAENELGDLGFSCDEDRITLKWDAPKSLKAALEAAKRSALKERDRSLREYDLAILRVWSAQSVDEAKQVVEALL
jgi:hypothetical protein